MITIIILLILAGVAINMALGDNGLFRRSKEAVNTWKSAEENETDVLQQAFNYISGEMGNKEESTEITYILRFDENKSANDTISNMPSNIMDTNKDGMCEFTIPNTVPRSVETRYFYGWSLTADGVEKYAAGDKITLTPDKPEITLYAVWESWGVGGGGGVPEVE